MEGLPDTLSKIRKGLERSGVQSHLPAICLQLALTAHGLGSQEELVWGIRKVIEGAPSTWQWVSQHPC